MTNEANLTTNLHLLSGLFVISNIVEIVILFKQTLLDNHLITTVLKSIDSTFFKG